MTLTGAFILHEFRTQVRSLRFRLLAGVHVVAAAWMPVVFAIVEYRNPEGFASWGGYCHRLHVVLPTLSGALALALSLDAITRERDEGSFAMLALASLSNAGYLLRRWAAICVVVLSVSVVPVVITAVAALALGDVVGDPLALIGPWFVETLPVVVAFSALGVGLGTITGGAVTALVVGVIANALVLGLANWALAPIGVTLANPLAWLSPAPRGGAQVVADGALPNKFLVTGSDAPWSTWEALEVALPEALPTLGLSLGVLALSVAWLRRTRPDVRPIRIRANHPLRTFLAMLNRGREGLVPDPALERPDWLLLAGGLLAAVLGPGYTVAHCRAVLADGDERYAVEGEAWPEPTEPGFDPVEWAVDGSISAGGRVDVVVRATLANGGAVPASHAAFSLNERVALAEVSSDGGVVSVQRRRERISLDLDPPLPPGGSRAVTFRCSGVPSRLDLPVNELRFREEWRSLRKARVRSDVKSMVGARRLPAASPRRVALAASDLVPVPRYEPWTLTEPARRMQDPSELVTPETRFPESRLRLRLQSTKGVVLATSCDDVSAAQGDANVVESDCALVIADLQVVGGAVHELAGDFGGARPLVLVGHGEFLLGHLAPLRQAASTLADAWPARQPLAGRVVVEQAPEFTRPGGDPWNPWVDEGLSFWEERAPRPVTVGERSLLAQPLDATWLARWALAVELGGARRAAASDALAWPAVMRTIALSRLATTDMPAVVDDRSSAQALVGPEVGRRWKVWQRARPVTIDLERRVGRELLRRVVEDYLRAAPDGATVAGLLAELTAASGVPLDRFLADYVEGRALPVLTLADVSFRAADGAWLTHGRVTNLADGEASCPVLARGQLDETWTTVMVPSQGSVEFAIRTASRPRSVQLDPRRQCHRLDRKGLAQSVENEAP